MHMYSVLRLRSHCRQMCPKSDFFFAHMWLRSVFVMTVWTAQTAWNLIVSIPICAISICGTKSDTCQMFCNATAVWTVMPDFMRLLRYSRSTFVIIPRWLETLKRFFIPKVIKTVAKGSQWKYSGVSELICITVATLQAKHEGSY